ncbi:MAG: spermidine/putrescine ABC transporter substrate-binding protein [Acidimicrobiia bacterium]|nr:spermidine/putrescine ABC transporter substrate-binding protein [Acidimicrobiia bacterium]
MSNDRSSKPPAGGLSRRDFLTRGAAVAGGLAAAPYLLGGSPAWAAVEEGAKVGGKLDVLNWIGYIDKKSKKDFPKQTGIKLKYSEALDDNNTFFAKYQEQFANDDHIGFDIVAPTTWMAARLIELEYVQPLPFDLMENRGSLRAELENPVWDPTGEFTLPWQTGYTGIAYNIEATGREITSVEDLFDPKFKGRVGWLLEMRDSLTLAMLSTGMTGEEIAAGVTFNDAKPAFDRLEKAAQGGQIRRFTGNSYVSDLLSGDFALNVSWSGDVAQLTTQEPNLRFVVPDEGGHGFWADVMCMVATSKRSKQVAAWLDYFYDPVNAARVADTTSYISPVADITDELATINPEAAENTILFPPQDVLDRLVQFPLLDPDDEERFDRRYAEITGG